MNNTAVKIGAAVVGGYLLGRRRKLKLAIGFGTWLVGQKLNLDPKKLVVDLGRELAASPKFGEFRDQVRTEVLGAGKSAASTLLTQSATRLADSLHSRTESLRGQLDGTASSLDIPGGEETERRPSKSKDSQSGQAADSPRGRGGPSRRSRPDGPGVRTARSSAGAQPAKAGSKSTSGDRPASTARSKRSSRTN